MMGLGTIINSTAIVVGGVIGHFTGKLFRQDQQDAVNKACGISVLFIAIAGAMQGMLHIDNGKILSGKSMLVVLCLALGTIIGEIIGIERGFEHFGEWLKVKSGNSGDKQFVNAFVTASLTVCIGAMAIVGAIQDGISGDYSTLAVKAVLDFIIVAVMTSSLGKGCIFSAIPVFLFEGAITVLARIISPIMTETALAYLSLIGAVLIFCVGLNLVWGKKYAWQICFRQSYSLCFSLIFRGRSDKWDCALLPVPGAFCPDDPAHGTGKDDCRDRAVRLQPISSAWKLPDWP